MIALRRVWTVFLWLTMEALRLRSRALIVAFSTTFGLACYDTKAIALRVRTQPTEMSCVEVADRVFADEGFVGAPGISGTDRLYTPRASVTTAMALRWGISVVVKDEVGPEKWGPCTFDLQALSADEGCGIQCPLTPQPGFDDITRKMATLLAGAFKGANQARGD